MTESRIVEVLVVGQTPPPHHGQAAMIQTFLEGTYKRLRLHYLRMSYSDNLTQVGRFELQKVFHLFELVWLTYRMRWRIGSSYLYYPPSGPKLVPILRDVVYLLCTRWLFRGTIFHYHAAGVSERIARLPAPLRMLARLAYGRATCSIRPSRFSPDDPAALGSLHSYEIPNAIKDTALESFGVGSGEKEKPGGGPPRILFVALLNESKGTLVLLDALALLLEQGIPFEADLVGVIENSTVKEAIEQRLANSKLKQSVTFHGRLIGDAKWEVFRKADVFVFPTFYESESFGLVLVEAMQFAIPVVATRWRGVQSVVVDGETGILVPIKDPAAVAAGIARLVQNPAEARRLGVAGRKRFLEEYTIERFRERMEAAILASLSREAGLLP